MGGQKAAKDLQEGEEIMMNSCPCQIETIQDPEELGKDEYTIRAFDVIDNEYYNETYSPDDMVTLANVVYEEKQVKESSPSSLIVEFTDGTESPARSQESVKEYWNQLRDHEMRMITSGVFATLITAAGRKVVQ